ncbi:dynamin family protein [Metabacillus malikii]|uniref:Small GTP-binding protein n=1 Tax=Metabacillus malikii TaxID=1504265 RepID=A0ABT9Z981_9BACI|nr:dynamin family protein [Metabacillus malikii]MDQ0228823.1 small GTP-binding protein [Metabacillus malikii]
MTATVKTDILIQRLITLHQQINNEEDKAKLVELVLKYHQEKLYIAFAGHFSAGKSSMINALLDEQVLPTSPIPTSANLVLLENGKPKVQLYSTNKEIIELNDHYSMEHIKEFCKQGDIERISIQKPYDHLSKNVVVMDTPGIDSTDAAHKLSTESMLHIADLIFYVTDYNHVQSEENFSFISEMKEKNKLIFLIVNQIDKHNESELPFQSFKTEIIESFAKIGLDDEDIFFTTLKKISNDENQLQEIKEIINRFIDEKEQHLDKNVTLSMKHVVLDHLEQYKSELQLTDINKSDVQLNMNDLLEQKRNVIREIDDEKKRAIELEQGIVNKVSAILKSSNIIPFETREKASLFIEACDPTYKVGFLFSKAKTEQERERRKQDLFQSLQSNVETQIVWHLTPLLKEYIDNYEITNVTIIQKAQEFSFQLSEDILNETLKPGASFNNQYVLTYSSDISELIKRKVKQKVMEIFEEIIEAIVSKKSSILPLLEEKQQKIEQELLAVEYLSNNIREYEVYEKSMLSVLESQKELFTITNVSEWLEQNPLHKRHVNGDEIIKKSKKLPEKLTETQHEKQAQPLLNNNQLFINQTESIISRLQYLNGFKDVTNSLKKKVGNYNSRTYTVALFGAFSAGKSSFANALIGHKLLPSSPNPTTATINKIAPPSPGKKHGHVEVKIKSKELLVDEVCNTIPLLKNSEKDFTVIHNQLLQLAADSTSEDETIKKYQTIFSEYEEITSDGMVIYTDVEHFQDYVANENKACIVEEVTVYYDCDITRAGITLVDTPGADSMHTRHTDVAFQYIKNADAILYVTYYNHPFSKGDREFLRQLGRVKDAFTLDKMFFIINAIDLAKDKQEVHLVKGYIEEQLLQQEIRNIRLYGVSSQHILNNQREMNQDFDKFHKQFEYFIEHELAETTIASIYEDLQQSNQRLLSMIEIAEKDATDKEKLKLHYLKVKEKIQQELSSITTNHVVKTVAQEIEELIFYVKQRLFLRFSDFFKEAFHPGAFTKDKNTQEILHNALQNFIRAIEFEVIQEIQATSLRIENFLQKTIEQEYLRIVQLVKEYTEDVSLSKPAVMKITSPKIRVESAKEWELQLKSALKLFRNPKSFFEKNEKQKMIDDMQEKFDSPLTGTLSEIKDDFSSYYFNVLEESILDLISNLKDQVDEGFNALMEVDLIDINEIKNINRELEDVIDIHH